MRQGATQQRQANSNELETDIEGESFTYCPDVYDNHDLRQLDFLEYLLQ
jgi:hypothetical protein